MTTIHQYIEHEYPKPVFSQMRYLESAVNTAGVMLAQTTFHKEGARAIFYQFIYWVPKVTIATPVNTPITFIDQFGTAIFTTLNNFTLPNYAPLIDVKKGGKFQISGSSADIVFTIAYQYIL